MKTPILSLVAALLLGVIQVDAQCTQKVAECNDVLAGFERLEGKYYRSELFPYEFARLKLTFYHDKVYRLAPCGQSKAGSPLIFNLYDKAGILVFSSKDDPKPHYDFACGVTGYFTLVAGYEQGGGCAAILFGQLDHEKAAARPDITPRKF